MCVAAQLLLSQIDIDASGTIDYEEFLAATVNLSQLEKEENMYRAFAHFDTDNSGYITEDELEAALRVRQPVSDLTQVLGLGCMRSHMLSKSVLAVAATPERITNIYCRK